MELSEDGWILLISLATQVTEAKLVGCFLSGAEEIACHMQFI